MRLTQNRTENAENREQKIYELFYGHYMLIMLKCS
jgi:hypothetical protein